MAGMMRMQQTTKKAFMSAEFFQDWIGGWGAETTSFIVLLGQKCTTEL